MWVMYMESSPGAVRTRPEPKDMARSCQLFLSSPGRIQASRKVRCQRSPSRLLSSAMSERPGKVQPSPSRSRMKRMGNMR